MLLALLLAAASAHAAFEPFEAARAERLMFLGGHVPEEANYFELALLAAERSPGRERLMRDDRTLMGLGRLGQRNMSAVCGRGELGRARAASTVTHYYVPLLKNYQEKPCKRIEGVCRFWRNDEEYIANYGKPDVKFKSAFCKNGIGYGLNENCTHPCRSLAASTKHHKGGEVIFFPELVGKKCGTGANQMIHDGFMVVNDTGDRRRFNHTGRFDFFWGECRKFKKGVCRDPGAVAISRVLSGSRFCRAWRPHDPGHNTDVKVAFYNAVRAEAIARGDVNAAHAFNLDAWTAPSHREAGRRLAERVRKSNRTLASNR